MLRVLVFLLCIPSWAEQRPTDLVVGVISPHRLKLTRALAELGSNVKTGFTSFGVVVQGNEPEIDLAVPREADVATVLGGIVSQLPGYTYEVVSDHLIDIYPTGIIRAVDNPLNIIVPEIHLTRVSTLDLFSKPDQFIPELKAFNAEKADKNIKACGGLGPGLGSDHSQIEIKLLHSTVKEILDAAAVANSSSALRSRADGDIPLGWVLQSQIEATGRRTDKWSFMVSVPRSWREQKTTEAQTTK